MIAQIDVASAGEIIFEGDKIAAADPKALRPGLDRRIGYVTQDDNLLPWRTTIDNVLFPLEVQGRLDDKARAHAQMLIEAVGLTGYERYYPHELSGGMRKRAALIRTLVYDPPVILMDEPFAAVDAQTRHAAAGGSAAAVELGRKTIIFVTHDIAEAIALGDRTLVLTRQPARIAAEHPIPIPAPAQRQGHLRAAGLCGDLRAHPGGGPMTTVDPSHYARRSARRHLAQAIVVIGRSCLRVLLLRLAEGAEPSARCSSPIRSTWSGASSR